MATDAITNDASDVLPVALQPVVDHLVTEDDTPVDNIFSEKQLRLLTEPLHSTWAASGQRRPFVAMSNVGLFFDIHRPPLVPNVLLSMDVELPADLHPKSHRSYFTWEYGKAPDVVIEVVSNREGGEDSQKLAAYARIGVRYYAIYDPKQWLGAEVLRGYRLDATEFHMLDEPLWFPGVGLGLRIWQGRYEDHDNTWLRWVDASGFPIPTGNERAGRLTEQLRKLGVEPSA
jgi:Uma2 family endonuclease